jgi:hypothetical protein
MKHIARFFLLLAFLAGGLLAAQNKKAPKLEKDELLLTYVATKKAAKGDDCSIIFTNEKNEKIVFDWADKHKPELQKLFFSQFPTEDADGNYDMSPAGLAGKVFIIKWHKVKLAKSDNPAEGFRVISKATEVK